MTPVINPWVFYFMDIADGVDLFFTIFGGVAVAAVIILTIIYFVEKTDGWTNEDNLKILKKGTTVTAWIAAIFLFIATIVPSQNTITKMLIAQNVTHERVETVTDTVETVYNDIMELFESNE